MVENNWMRIGEDEYVDFVNFQPPEVIEIFVMERELPEGCDELGIKNLIEFQDRTDVIWKDDNEQRSND